MYLSRYRLFSVVFLFALFFPFFLSYIGTAGAILVNGGLILGLIQCLFIFKSPKFVFDSTYHKQTFMAILTIFVFFFFHIALSMLIGVSVGGVNIIQRDFYEFHRPVLYLLVFVFSFTVFYRDGLVLKFERLLFFAFVILVLIGLNQYVGFYDYVSQLYTKQHNINSRRVAAPFLNPYDYAFMMSFFVLYFFLKMIYSAIIFIIPLTLALSMFVLPQSRSVAGTFLVGFFVVLPLVLLLLEFDFKKLFVPKKLLLTFFLMLLAIILFVLSVPYLLENFPYLTDQFVRFLQGGGVGRSGNIRLEQFLFALEKAFSNPLILLFGNGPAKSELEFVESIYNYQFYRYGLVGFLLYFLLLICLGSCFAWKVLKNIGRQHPSYPIFLALLVWFLIIPLMSIGNNFTEQVRLSFFFYTMLGFLSANFTLANQNAKRALL